jgi:hypothetical protein
MECATKFPFIPEELKTTVILHFSSEFYSNGYFLIPQCPVTAFGDKAHGFNICGFA